MSQLTFDLDAIGRPLYAGPAPLHFTVDYFTPHELVAAHKEAHRDREWGMPNPPHTWDLGITTGWCNRATPGHACWLLQVDLRCKCKFWEDRRDFSVGSVGCFCVGTYLHQANCPDCRWHSFGSENEVVEAWHDHAWPGWRDLPVVPFMDAKTQMSKKGAAQQLRWVEANYPVEWQTPGAPIITERSRMGTRHVPGRSPWGGFDLSAADRMRWFPPSGVVGA